jgi:hypothetical protein
MDVIRDVEGDNHGWVGYPREKALSKGNEKRYKTAKRKQRESQFERRTHQKGKPPPSNPEQGLFVLIEKSNPHIGVHLRQKGRKTGG